MLSAFGLRKLLSPSSKHKTEEAAQISNTETTCWAEGRVRRGFRSTGRREPTGAKIAFELPTSSTRRRIRVVRRRWLGERRRIAFHLAIPSPCGGRRARCTSVQTTIVVDVSPNRWRPGTGLGRSLGSATVSDWWWLVHVEPRRSGTLARFNFRLGNGPTLLTPKISYRLPGTDKKDWTRTRKN